MGNKKFLIFGVLIIFIVTIICLFMASKMKNSIPLVCREDSYEIYSYSHGYNPEGKERYLFISNQKDFDNLLNVLSVENIKKLNIQEHDYLIYFLNSQQGCDREIRLNCVTYEKNKIILKTTKYNIDTNCNMIFNDSFIIELEKGKYNNELKVELETK